MSCEVSSEGEGMGSAPMRQSASMVTQYSMRRYRMSMTRSPFLMPLALKALASFMDSFWKKP
jgi:hypothetical protein